MIDILELFFLHPEFLQPILLLIAGYVIFLALFKDKKVLHEMDGFEKFIAGFAFSGFLILYFLIPTYMLYASWINKKVYLNDPQTLMELFSVMFLIMIFTLLGRRTLGEVGLAKIYDKGFTFILYSLIAITTFSYVCYTMVGGYPQYLKSLLMSFWYNFFNASYVSLILVFGGVMIAKLLVFPQLIKEQYSMSPFQLLEKGIVRSKESLIIDQLKIISFYQVKALKEFFKPSHRKYFMIFLIAIVIFSSFIIYLDQNAYAIFTPKIIDQHEESGHFPEPFFDYLYLIHYGRGDYSFFKLFKKCYLVTLPGAIPLPDMCFFYKVYLDAPKDMKRLIVSHDPWDWSPTVWQGLWVVASKDVNYTIIEKNRWVSGVVIDFNEILRGKSVFVNLTYWKKVTPENIKIDEISDYIKLENGSYLNRFFLIIENNSNMTILLPRIADENILREEVLRDSIKAYKNDEPIEIRIIEGYFIWVWLLIPPNKHLNVTISYISKTPLG